MLKGYLRSKGVQASERKLRSLLPRVTPQWFQARQRNAQERTNPSLYVARYFGHKLHIDQNEKLVHYGVTYVLARDGFSGKLVSGAVMARKNNKIIYDEVYRTTLLQFGLWDQVRVDHGKEFYLLLYIQERLRVAGRGDLTIAPYVQTTSTQNHIIERVWVELNHRVTYPVKRVIVSMDQQRAVNMDDETTKFCVSYVLQQVCSVGMIRMIEAWNNHHIARKGIPNSLHASNCRINHIHSLEVPIGNEAIEEYRRQGGSITDPHDFGEDPLASDPTLLQQRQQVWEHRLGMSYSDVYSQLMTGNDQVLRDAVLKFIDITNELLY